MESQPVAESTNSLPAGQQLGGGKYAIVKHVRNTAVGALFQATDSTTGNPVSVQQVAPALATQENIEKLQAAITKAASLSHKNLAKVIELVQEADQVYVVSEFLDGQPLHQMLERKLASDATFSPKQVSNIAAHLCAAAVECSKIGGHLAITLESVSVNKAGRVKLTGLGLGAIAPSLAATLGGKLAPEAAKGLNADSKADVYGVGAVVYELLVGRPPAKGCPRPSEAVPELSALVDQFVGASTHGDPAKRPGVDKLAAAVGRALSTPSAAHSAQRPVAKPGRPSLAQAIASPDAEAKATPSTNDSEALSRALEDGREHLLITKGKLDYGPFSLAAIVDQIKSNLILPGNLLVDNDTGQRVNVEDHPLLSDLVDAAKQRRDDERRANAEVVHAKQERSRGAIVYVIVAAAVIAVGGGAYTIVKALGSDSNDDTTTLAGIEGAKLQAKITFPSQAQVKKRRGKRRGKSSKPGVGGKAGGWDDSLNLDMAGANGGNDRLDNSQVNPVIQRSGGKLARCLRSTKSSDAFIEFMVKGTGKVYQVRVNGETGTPLAKCLRKAMMSMQFPTFNGVRSKHNFDMSF